MNIETIYNNMLDNAKDFTLEKRVARDSCIIYTYSSAKSADTISLYFHKCNDGRPDLKAPYRIVINEGR